MLAFEVSARNGRRLCIGGVADQDLPLSCIVTNVWGRESGDGRNKNMDRFCVSIHGVRKADSQAEQLWWRPNYEMNVGDEVVVRSIEAAVYRSSPLPLPPDPQLFERNLRFTFKPEQ